MQTTPAILIATSNGSIRRELLDKLALRGHVPHTLASWADFLHHLLLGTYTLVLVDGALNEVSAQVITGVIKTMNTPPQIRSIGARLAPLRELRSDAHLKRLTDEVAEPLLGKNDTRRLGLMGLGKNGLTLVREFVDSQCPLRIQGERGTGKEWVARVAHRISQRPGPFYIIRPTERPSLKSDLPGTLYLEQIDRHVSEHIRWAQELATSSGWGLMCGTRKSRDETEEEVQWSHLLLRPLRERPREIRELTLFFLELYRKKLHLPYQRVNRKIWRLIEAHPWFGNHRELESFVVQATTSCRGSSLSPETLPKRVLKLLENRSKEIQHTESFEFMVEERLRHLVHQYEPDPTLPTLHRLIIDSTERALLRLALQRTGGNQKAAAELLGLSRNTLKSKLVKLDPLNENETL